MTTTSPNKLVQRRLKDFKRRCSNYGDAALKLAYHAALPVALNPELLHFLRINFFLDPPSPLPYTVEFEFLTSGLCREIDTELYEIEPEIRDVLLQGLSREYGRERIREVATLLWQYVEHHSPWADRVELERSQQLTALNFLDPAKAKEWLDTAEGKASLGRGEREWFIAMRQEIQQIPDFLESTENEIGIAHPPKVFISYSWGSREHMDRVLALSDRLRREGIDCNIDQYEVSPPEGWPRWMENQLDWAEFVLVICTEQYYRRFRGQEEAGRGRGVTWEGAIITQDLYDAQVRNTKFIPVVFSPLNDDHIPSILRSFTRYSLDTEEEYRKLYRYLTNQPSVLRPPVGPHPHQARYLSSELGKLQTSKVVISHSSIDKPFVERLATDLRTREGIDAWLDKWEILPGDRISEKLEEGLSNAGILVLVLSPESVNSQWLSYEKDAWLTAQVDEEKRARQESRPPSRRLIPVLYKNCEKPFFLQSFLHVGINDENYEEGFQQLVIGVRAESGKPPLKGETTPAPVPPSTTGRASSGVAPRILAFNLLKVLLPAQFDEVIFLYEVDESQLPTNVAQVQKAKELIKYAAQKEGGSLSGLLDAIYQAAPHLKR